LTLLAALVRTQGRQPGYDTLPMIHTFWQNTDPENSKDSQDLGHVRASVSKSIHKFWLLKLKKPKMEVCFV